MTLSVDALAQMLGESPARIQRLSDTGLLGDGPPFPPGVVHRARVLVAFDDGGVPLDAIATAIDVETAAFDFLHRFYPDPEPTPGRPYRDVVAPFGGHADIAAELYEVLGLAQPDPSTRIGDEECLLVTDLVRLCGQLDDARPLLRVLHAYGRAARTAAQTALGVYGEFTATRQRDLDRLSRSEAFDKVLAPWARLSQLSPRLLAWAHQRHLENAIDAYNVESTERYLAERDILPERDRPHPAMVFVDLTGFTRVSQIRGDEASAELATRLGALAERVATEHGGSVVKLLGDGVMVHVPTADAGARAGLGILGRIRSEGLGSAHGGMHTGPVVYRDGDYFGRTVNLAARIGDAAPDGQFWATSQTAALVTDPQMSLSPVGAYTLQGLDEPVPLFRITRSTGTDEAL